MDILMAKRYPVTRCFVMAALLLTTVVAVTGVLEWQDQQDDQLWSVEQAPHPWPWPGQDRWTRPTFDFGPVFAKTTGVVAALPITTATFVHDPRDPFDVLSTNYRWAYVNLRGGRGSIRIDRQTDEIMRCTQPYREWGLGIYPDQWCGDDGHGDTTVLR